MYRTVLVKLFQQKGITIDEATEFLAELITKITNEENEELRNLLIELGRGIQSYSGPTKKLSNLAMQIITTNHDRLIQRAMKNDISREEMQQVLEDCSGMLDILPDSEIKQLIIRLRDLAVESVSLKNTDEDNARLKEITEESTTLMMKVLGIANPGFVNVTEDLSYDPWAVCENEVKKS
jgi:hypothetical protein